MVVETCTFMYIKIKFIKGTMRKGSKHCTNNLSKSPVKATRLTFKFFSVCSLIYKVQNLKTEHSVVQMFTI